MQLPAKEVQCQCGASMTITRDRDWCLTCGHAVFYQPNERKFNKIANLFMVISAVTIVGFVIYMMTGAFNMLTQ